MSLYEADDTDEGFLTGQLLIAMPQMSDPRFRRSVVYICSQSHRGAMGLIVNKPMPQLSFIDLLEQLEIKTERLRGTLPIHYGGPVETGHGFVLHSMDYTLPDATLKVSNGVGLTATIDVLKAVARGSGPSHAFLALGYAGWTAGQLEGEIRANGWLHCEADEELVFGSEIEHKWERALSKLGIDAGMLSGSAGTA